MSHIHKQGGKYSYAYIQALLARVKIEEVVGDFVQLRRVNERYAYGFCPIHQEQSPSFTLSEEGQFYHCYGCGSHGNTIQFLIQYFNPYGALEREEDDGWPFLNDRMLEHDERRRRFLKKRKKKDFGYLDAIRYLAKKYRYWPSAHKRLRKRLEKI